MFIADGGPQTRRPSSKEKLGCRLPKLRNSSTWCACALATDCVSQKDGRLCSAGASRTNRGCLWAVKRLNVECTCPLSWSHMEISDGKVLQRHFLSSLPLCATGFQQRGCSRKTVDLWTQHKPVKQVMCNNCCNYIRPTGFAVILHASIDLFLRAQPPRI